MSLVCAVVVVSACGGGSPTAPSASPFVSDPPGACEPQTVQCLIDGAVVFITANGVDVGAGSTQTVAAVSSFSIRFDYRNTTGQNVWFGTLFVRDDGMERFVGCLGLGGGFTGGGAVLTAQVQPDDTMYTPGHTVRAFLVSMFGPSPSLGQCALRTSTGEFNRDVVQAQRLLVTFVLP